MSVARPAIGAPRRRRAAAFGVMAASGFAGLGYQIVWTQQSASWLGHEAAAVLAVVTAFFGGLALGALAFGSRIERSRRPQHWYAACELAIALWSLALAALLPAFGGWALRLVGPQTSPAWQWTVAFCGTFTVLLPATAAMGATLPAMERLLASHAESAGRWLAGLYACNTGGAVVGVLAAAFWLVPTFGLAVTAALCALLNVACAAAAWALGRPGGRSAGGGPAAAVVAAADASIGTSAAGRQEPPAQLAFRVRTADRRAGRAPLLWLLAATGLLGIGYEVLVVRVISQLAENTVYTFAILLAVYLVGTALGAAAYQRVVARRAADPAAVSADADAAAMRGRLLWLLAVACLLGTASLSAGESIRDLVLRIDGGGMAGALAAEAALALAAFALPTFAMGALFGQLAREARAAGVDFGRALGVNTLGAAAAPLLFGVLLLPAFGAKAALLLVAAGYLALGLQKSRPVTGWWCSAAVVAALGIWAPPLVFVDLPPGGQLVSYREGAMAAVSVVEDAQGVRRLRIDNRQQEGSSATRFADARQAWLPLLLHPRPRHALFLGLGTGVTASSAAEDPSLQVDVAELLPDVIAASADFRPADDPGGVSGTTAAVGAVNKPTGGTGAAPATAAGLAAYDGRLNIVAADARRFVRTASRRYDVIVSDNFHPARSGSGALYTVEHFAAVRARLAEDGVFCQWLPLHQLDRATLRSIVQSFVRVYPGGLALLATNSLETPVLGLLARADDGRIDLADIHRRLAGPAMARRAAELGVVDELALLGSVIAGPRALSRFAGDAPLNTDDRPIVAYRAPRITYAPDSMPRQRLLALLRELDVEPAEVLDVGSAAAAGDAAVETARWLQRLAAYWSARDGFMAAGQGVRPSADVRDMLSQVREPLLGVLRISPDFRPAYDPLLRMAIALAPRDAAAARALLAELVAVQPARPEAAAQLRQLGGSAN